MDRYIVRSSTSMTIAVLLMALLMPALAEGQPYFSKSFSPATVGPGNITRLQYELDNWGSPVTDLAFSETLAAGIVIANPAQLDSDCNLAVFSALEDGNSLSMSEARLGSNSQCGLSLDVVAPSIPGYHTSSSGELTSSAGTGDFCEADLVVDANLPALRMSFDASSLFVGQATTMTVVIDNQVSGGMQMYYFTTAFPEYVVVAPEPKYQATASCFSGTAAPLPGSNSLNINGAVMAGQVCTVQVDLIATHPGTFPLSGDLLVGSQSVGRAVAQLVVSLPPFTKRFVTNPIAPGMTALLEFSLYNFQRSQVLMGLEFVDDLHAMLPGSQALGLPLTDICGPGSSLDGTSLLVFSSGQLAAEENCSFQVEIELPVDASTGTYVNETSPVSYTSAGQGGTWQPARADLRVAHLIQLQMDAASDLLGVITDGDSLQLDFVLTNTSDQAATAIGFDLPIQQAIPGVVLPPTPLLDICGMGFMLSHRTDVYMGGWVMQLAGGSLPPQSSCAFSVVYTALSSMPSGVYSIETEPMQATMGGQTTYIDGVSTAITIVRAPTLSMQFVDEPYLPGESVELEFTLRSHENDPVGFSNIAFSADLGAALTGLQAIDLPLNDACGPGSRLEGSSLLTFSGGRLPPNSVCTFSATLQLPDQALVGQYFLMTSAVGANTQGMDVSSMAASAEFELFWLQFEKEFVPNPIYPGGLTSLRYTFSNHSSASPASGMFFTEALNNTYPGLLVEGALPSNPCGVGSSITGSNFIVFSGGSLAPESSCSFDLPLRIPPMSEVGSYAGRSNGATAIVEGVVQAIEPSVALLHIADPLLLTKTFVDDPVGAGDVVQLQFLLANADEIHAATGLSFSDDLESFLPGTVALGLPLVDDCGPSALMTGSSLLMFDGGSLAPSSTCSFTVPLQLPAQISLNTEAVNLTSPLTGTLDSLVMVSNPAIDDLELEYLSWGHTYLAPGLNRRATVRFTIENRDVVNLAPFLSFSLDLNAVLPGLAVADLPDDGMCGPQSIMNGNLGVLQFSRGQLEPGESCTFDVVVAIPAATPMAVYQSRTSALMADDVQAAGPSLAALTVDEEPDSDGDGVLDSADLDALDPTVCRDSDHDSCDDCAITGADGSGGDPANDGVDSDVNGICDAGEPQGDDDLMGDSDLLGDDDMAGDTAAGGDDPATGGDQNVASAGDSDTSDTADSGCSCRGGGGSVNLLWLGLLAMLVYRRRSSLRS